MIINLDNTKQMGKKEKFNAPEKEKKSIFYTAELLILIHSYLCRWFQWWRGFLPPEQIQMILQLCWWSRSLYKINKTIPLLFTSQFSLLPHINFPFNLTFHKTKTNWRISFFFSFSFFSFFANRCICSGRIPKSAHSVKYICYQPRNMNLI